MAVLLNAVTTDSNPASATGTATADSTRQLIEIPGDSTFAPGAVVVIQGASVNTAGKFSSLDKLTRMTSPGHVIIELPIGHFVRAIAKNLGTGSAITVNMLAVQ